MAILETIAIIGLVKAAIDGGVTSKKRSLRTCGACGGSGQIRNTGHHMNPCHHGYQDTVSTCNACGGSGSYYVTE